MSLLLNYLIKINVYLISHGIYTSVNLNKTDTEVHKHKCMHIPTHPNTVSTYLSKYLVYFKSRKNRQDFL
jgi:hypothetical protein